LEYLESQILQCHYFTALEGVIGETFMRGERAGDQPDALGLITFCVLVMKNGFTAVGQSACAAKENYREDIAHRLARQKAVNEIWPLLGYELRTKLALVAAAPGPTNEDFRTYVGTKVIHAKPMTLGDYNTLRRWMLPKDEQPEVEGYMVEYADGGKPNHEDFVGYVSWSPKDVFEKAYVDLGASPNLPKVDTWITRLQDEWTELGAKVAKLHDYLDSDGYHLLPTIEKAQLRNQYEVMMQYWQIVNARLTRAETPVNEAAKTPTVEEG
jgi:hypothetical protein